MPAETEVRPMRDRRLGLVGIGLAIASVLFVTVGGAQSRNRDLFTELNTQLIYVALPLSLFVLLVLVYATVKFYDNDDPKPTTEDPALEITWTAATAIILLFVGVSGYTILVSPYVSTGQPAELGGADIGAETPPETDGRSVVVTGHQWGWETTYPEADVITEDAVVIPANEDVTIWLTTTDVIHSFFSSDLGIKQDAFPEQYTRINTHVYEPGTYDARCTEFCGAGHARMEATVVVLDPSEYETWLEDNDGNGTVDAPEPA